MAYLDHNRMTPAHRKAPLRVALFSGNYDCIRDGANQALNRLVAFLLGEGVQVRIYAPRAPKPAFAAVGEICPVRSLAIPGRPEYRLALGLTRAARRDLDDFRPDIIHLSAPDILGRQALNYGLRHDVPVVASLHTRFETYLDYYRLSFLRPRIEAYLRRFYGDCAHILAPTAPIADDLARTHDASRVSIWARGVDPEMFGPSLRDPAFRSAHGFAPDDVVPLFFGRLVKEKGLGVFVETMSMLAAKGYSVRPLIVGEGPEHGWLAGKLPGAVFTGHLEGRALGRAVASADILVNPSVTEAFGNVNLEAMASGLAIVTADVPSAATLITDRATGLLVPPGQPSAYAHAVMRLIDNPAIRHALGAAALVKAGRYRWRDVLGQVLSCYRQVLGRTDALPLLRAA